MSADQIDRLRSNIGDAVMAMKKQGTTGASLDCLRQITSTRGLTLANPNHWCRMFEEHAPAVAKSLRFRVWDVLTGQ